MPTINPDIYVAHIMSRYSTIRRLATGGEHLCRVFTIRAAHAVRFAETWYVRVPMFDGRPKIWQPIGSIGLNIL